MIEYKLYLGRRTQSGKLVDSSSFHHFLKEKVDKELRGYTVFSAEGYFDSHSEECYVLTYIGTPFDRSTVERLGHTYNKVFHQSSVLLTENEVESRLLESPPENLMGRITASTKLLSR